MSATEQLRSRFLGWQFLNSRNHEGFLGGSAGKESTCNAGDIRDSGLIPGSGRCPGDGHGNPLQYSCRENPMDRGAWWAIVHGGHRESDMTEWFSTAHTENSSTRIWSHWILVTTHRWGTNNRHTVRISPWNPHLSPYLWQDPPVFLCQPAPRPRKQPPHGCPWVPMHGATWDWNLPKGDKTDSGWELRGGAVGVVFSQQGCYWYSEQDGSQCRITSCIAEGLAFPALPFKGP